MKILNISRRSHSVGLLIGSLLALTNLAGCTQTSKTADDSIQAAPQVVRTISQEDALADFDAMWQIINDTHFDPTFNGVDWEGVKAKYRPQAAQAMNRQQIRRVMSQAMDELGQSHFGIIPEAPAPAPAPKPEAELAQASPQADASQTDAPSVIDANGTLYTEVAVEDAPSKTDAVIPSDSSTDGQGQADTGIEVRIIDGQAVVSSVRDESSAQRAGVKTGWILSQVRDNSVEDRLAQLAESVAADEVGIHGVGMIEHQLQGPEGSTIDLTFVDGDDQEQTRTLTREPMPGEFIKFGNLPPLSTHLEWDRLTETSPEGTTSEIGVISFNIWMMPIAAKFERAMYELRDVDGIIIDLRGNPGGIGALSSALGRFIMDEPGSLGTMKMRSGNLNFNITPVVITTWGERLKPFTGPVAILTDSGTASTSEVFAGGLQSLGRVEVFGSRSAGMALPAGMDKLPSGDVLLHAIADFVTSTGYQLEHGGVVPEHIIPLTRNDLLNGIDAPKQAAIDWIEQSADQ